MVTVSEQVTDNGHSALAIAPGRRLARGKHGRDAVGPLYAALGALICDASADAGQADGGYSGTLAFLAPALAEASLPDLADAVDGTSLDTEIRQKNDEGLALTGKDVGTPIIWFQPPVGVAPFGPGISRPPVEAEVVPLWDSVVGLASFPSFAELKRSLRERPPTGQFRCGRPARPEYRKTGTAEPTVTI